MFLDCSPDYLRITTFRVSIYPELCYYRLGLSLTRQRLILYVRNRTTKGRKCYLKI